REGGAAVLFVSHSPQQVLELCDVALLLDGGQMLLMDEPRRVVAEYQRLLYAPPADAARLRGEAQAARVPAAVDADAAAPAAEAHPATASFDPALRSASLVEYAQHGARIGAPRIETPAGAPVNVLVRGDPYVVAYDVEFTA